MYDRMLFLEVLMKKEIVFGLTGFELLLWSTSVVLVTLGFVLAPATDWLTLIASLIGVTALIFVAKGYVIGQVLTIVFAVFYGVISFYFRYYGEMITYLCMTAPAAVLSMIAWLRHPFEKGKEVAVRKLSAKTVCAVLLLTGVVTVGFYFILRAFGNANLWVSTLSVATSFLASAFTFLRSPYYALAYAANDVVLIVLWVLAAMQNAAYVPMVLCFVMFLCNDSYGFFNWHRMRRRQAET